MVGGGPVGTFSLTDHFGKPVTEKDFAGRFMLVYFGFTHCRVVCPRSLKKLTGALERLGPGASAITPLFVSVDPQRDNIEVMKRYLEANFPRFLGLTGSAAKIEAAKKSFRVFAERRADPNDPDGYAVPHTAIAYLMGPDGSYRDHFADVVDEDAVVRRLAAALSKVPAQAAG